MVGQGRAALKKVLPGGAVEAIRRGRKRAPGAVPLPVSRMVRALRREWDRNDPVFGPGARLGPLAQKYLEVSSLPGYFTYDDASAFTLILSSQSASGVQGDVLEIGSYHGRSTVFMASCVQPGERLIVCDTFEESTEFEYQEPPSPKALRRNLARWSGELADEQVDIREGRSDALDLAGVQLRFAHVDGGHTHDVALGDLRLVARHLVPGGAVAVDDYQHPEWPEVTTAVDAFLAEAPEFRVLADVNRWAESGRKLYLSRP